MNQIFNLLYWSTFSTKGTLCCPAGRRKAQVMQFQAVSAQSPVPRNRHHDWPHSALTQQPQHPEEGRQSSDEAQKKCSAQRETLSLTKGLMDSVQASPTLPLQLEKTISHNLLSSLHLWKCCICGVLMLVFFQWQRRRKAGKLHKGRR